MSVPQIQYSRLLQFLNFLKSQVNNHQLQAQLYAHNCINKLNQIESQLRNKIDNWVNKSSYTIQTLQQIQSNLPTLLKQSSRNSSINLQTIISQQSKLVKQLQTLQRMGLSINMISMNSNKNDSLAGGSINSLGTPIGSLPVITINQRQSYQYPIKQNDRELGGLRQVKSARSLVKEKTHTKYNSNVGPSNSQFHRVNNYTHSQTQTDFYQRSHPYPTNDRISPSTNKFLTPSVPQSVKSTTSIQSSAHLSINPTSFTLASARPSTHTLSSTTRDIKSVKSHSTNDIVSSTIQTLKSNLIESSRQFDQQMTQMALGINKWLLEVEDYIVADGTDATGRSSYPAIESKTKDQKSQFHIKALQPLNDPTQFRPSPTSLIRHLSPNQFDKQQNGNHKQFNERIEQDSSRSDTQLMGERTYYDAMVPIVPSTHVLESSRIDEERSERQQLKKANILASQSRDTSLNIYTELQLINYLEKIQDKLLEAIHKVRDKRNKCSEQVIKGVEELIQLVHGNGGQIVGE